MSGITEDEMAILEKEIGDSFETLSEHLDIDIEETKQQLIKKIASSDWGRDIVEKLKEEVMEKIRDKLKDEIKAEIEGEVFNNATKIIRQAVEKLFQIKGISVSGFTPSEKMEMEYILKDFGL